MLAIAFAVAGQAHLLGDVASLERTMAWVADAPVSLVRFIGGCEVLGAIGVVAPSATRILPHLAPTAALGLGAIALLATLVHVGRCEWSALPITLGLAALALLVVWGRSRAAPIAPR